MRIVLIYYCLVFLASCSENENKGEHAGVNKDIYSRTIPVFENFDDLSPSIFCNDDTTYVINFWATSCPPCIKEMPHFIQLEKEISAHKSRVLLISLDMKRDLESRVYPFVEKYNITPEVALLADQNYSAWTEKIDSSWYGALPATLIIKNGKRKFFMGAFDTYAELEHQVTPFLNPIGIN